MEAPARPDAQVHSAREEKLAALREEIGRVGRARSLSWDQTGWWVALLGGAGVATSGMAVAGLYPPAMPWLLGIGAAAAIGATVIATGAMVGAVWREQRDHRQLRRELRKWESAAVAPVLRALTQDQDEGTCALAQSLLRDLGLPTELTPARTPEGSGAEVSRVASSGRER